MREFTIWCVWRGVGMRVGHPRLVQPDQRELFQICFSTMEEAAFIIKVGSSCFDWL